LGDDGISAPAEADVKNPLLEGGINGAGRRSAEKKKQRMKERSVVLGAKSPSPPPQDEAKVSLDEERSDSKASSRPPT